MPGVAAGASATVALPEWAPVPDVETWVTVRAELAVDAPWAPARHVVAHTQYAVTQPLRPPHPAQQVRQPHTVCDTALESTARPAARPALEFVAARPALEFDERTGRLRRLHGLDVDGPRLELWRAPTDNDRGIANDSPDGRSSESRWRERGPRPARPPRGLGRPGRARRTGARRSRG